MRLSSNEELTGRGSIIDRRGTAVECVGSNILVSTWNIQDRIGRQDLVAEVYTVDSSSGSILCGSIQCLLDGIQVGPREVLAVSIDVPPRWLDDGWFTFNVSCDLGFSSLGLIIEPALVSWWIIIVIPSVDLESW